mmetsp:Transcript_6584/g.14313  ORF Transcript_6584/g.14313 Transcript_6584/m.14313 type:complete len:80 (+) Transcript_6584:250-489(+)
MVGMTWRTSKGDPATDVARSTSILVDELISADNGKKAKIKNGSESTKQNPREVNSAGNMMSLLQNDTGVQASLVATGCD